MSTSGLYIVCSFKVLHPKSLECQIFTPCRLKRQHVKCLCFSSSLRTAATWSCVRNNWFQHFHRQKDEDAHETPQSIFLAWSISLLPSVLRIWEQYFLCYSMFNWQINTFYVNVTQNSKIKSQIVITGQSYSSIKASTTRLNNSFYPRTIITLKSALKSHTL